MKGVTLRSALQALQRLRGKAGFDATVGFLPDHLAEEVRFGTIIASRWYPIEMYCALHAAMIAGTREGDRIIREVEREAARADMTGVYRIAFKLISPQTLITLSSRLFNTYYDTGTVETLESRKGHVRIRWTGCTGFNRTIWVGIIASCEQMLELAGAKNVRTHVRSGGGNDEDFAEAEAYWT